MVGCTLIKFKKAEMKFIKYILSFSVVLSFFGCAKEEVKITDTEIGHSRIVYFPSIETKGEKLIILKQGDTFTDPGATALLAGKPVQFTVTGGPVTTATGGLFNLLYTAANPEGDKVSDWRTVVVIGNDVAANDFSGTYLRPGFVTSTWTKTAPGIYTVENPGGAGVGAGLKVIAVNYTGNKIAIPKHISPDMGVVSSGSESYTPGPPATIKYAFFAGGYGTQVRTFVKQ
jgi:hypothetical protein